MSRYVRKFGTIEYAYGYDTPLEEYFFDKCDSKLATDHNEDGYVFQISNHFSMMPHPRTPKKQEYTNGEIMDIIKEEEKLIGQKIWHPDHLDAIAADLQF